MEPFPVLPRRRSARVWWREPRSGHVSFELGVDEQDVEFVDFVDDLSALVDHDIPFIYHIV